MKTKDLPGEKAILIEKELFTITKNYKNNYKKDERLRKVFCWTKNILYIGTFILLVFLIFMIKDAKKVYYDTGLSVSDDPVTKQTVIEKVAELQGLCFYKEIKNVQTQSLYNYTICPYEEITQSYAWMDNPLHSREVNLGSWDGEMDVFEKEDSLAMHYYNGTTDFCTDGNTTFARSTDINFLCGSSDEIVSVNEFEICSYTITFSVNCNNSDTGASVSDNPMTEQTVIEQQDATTVSNQAWTCGNRDPQPCDFFDWFDENLWASYVESFNFASKKWEEFTDALTLMLELESYNVTYPAFHTFQPLFRRFDSNRDSEVSTEEFSENGPTGFNGHFDEFSEKYWPMFDTDNSGTLDFEEIMYFYTAVCDGAARLLIKGFDENGNGILDGQETAKFKKEFVFGTDLDVWIDSQRDGDNNTATKAELVQYLLRID